MTTPNPNAPEFSEGYKAGFHEGVEQARKELQKKPDEKKPEEKKEEEKPAPKKGFAALIHNRVVQVIAAIIVLLLRAESAIRAAS